MEIEVGAVLEGRVTGITKFGAFVALPGGRSGLIHISEVANSFVSDIHDFLSDGQTVKVRVLNIGADGKISLSAKRAQEETAAVGSAAAPRSMKPKTPVVPARQTNTSEAYVPVRSGDQNFEDKLKQFMQESDKKMSGNKLFEQQRKSRSRRK